MEADISNISDEAMGTPAELDAEACAILAGTGLDLEQGKRPLVGVGDAGDKGDAGAGVLSLKSPRRDMAAVYADPLARLGSDVMIQAYRELFELEKRLRTNPDAKPTARAEWRHSQDEIIQFLKMDTPIHTITGREPDACYRRALTIIRTGE
jgi:hypothetical protein